MWALLSRFGLGRAIAWLGASFSRVAVLSWIIDKFGVFWSYSYSLIYNLWPAFFDQVAQGAQLAMEETVRAVSGPVVFVLSRLMGLPISIGDVDSVVEGPGTPQQREALGGPIAALLESVFDEGSVADGYQMRLPGEAERANFRRFIGTNLRVQIGSILTGVLKDRFPGATMDGLGDVGERIEKALGFEDAMEEILEPLMEMTIVEGMKKRFNRVIKPTDLSIGDAVDARIRNYIGDQIFTAIADNEGIRPDIRDILFKLRGKNLTQSDVQDLFNNGRMTATEVFTYFRENGYLEPDATIKEDLVVNDRLWKLQAELVNVREQQFVKGVIDEGTFRSYLSAASYGGQEEDIQVAISLAKRTLLSTTAAKRVTGSFNVTPERIKAGQQAIAKWNIRNADRVSISNFGEVGERGERAFTPTASETYTLTAENELGTETYEAVVIVADKPIVKRPTATFSASPSKIKLGSPVELKWVTGNATQVVLDGVGPVAEAGATFVIPVLTTIYTLRATNEAGTTVRQDVVFVELPDIGGDNPQRPTASLSISPGTLPNRYRAQAEVKWSTNNATRRVLIDPSGAEREVEANGAIIIEPTESGVWTLRASNDFGQRVVQDAILVPIQAPDVPEGPTQFELDYACSLWTQIRLGLPLSPTDEAWRVSERGAAAMAAQESNPACRPGPGRTP